MAEAKTELISLAVLYQDFHRSDDEVKNILETFRCSRNPDVEHFLHNKALEFELRDRSRTYLWLIPENSRLIVAGYFTLAIETIEIGHLSKSKQKKLNKGYNPNKPYISAYLIGQLGRSDLVPKCILDGKEEILPKAISLIEEAKELVGTRLVVVDVIDGDGEKTKDLVKWYQDFGFKELDLIDSGDKKLLRLYLILK